MAMGNAQSSELPQMVDEWLDLLGGLIGDVRTWAGADCWESRLTGRDVNEAGGVRYEVPVLVLDRGAAEVALVPVTRTVPGADGLVDLYLLPDFDVVASLYRQEGQWFCHYVFHRDPSATLTVSEAERFPLDEASLHRVLNDIAAPA